MRPRLLPLLLLLTAALPLVAEVPFSEPRRTGPAAYAQAAPVIASNGFDYLVAWTTVAQTPAGGSAWHVYATQVRSDGTVAGDIARQLDAENDQPPLYAHGVSLSAGRDGYFAAWMSDKGMTAAVLDSFGRVELRTTLPQEDPYLSTRTLTAWDGSTHIVLSGFAGPYVATLLDDNARVIASNIAVGDTHGEYSVQAVAADSAGFLVLATRRGFAGGNYADTIYGRRISTTGSLGEWFVVRSVASAVGGISVMNDGARDVIAWSDQFGLWTVNFDPQTNTAGTSRQLSPVGAATLTRITKALGKTWIVYSTAVDNDDFALPLDSDGSAGTPVALGNGYRPDIATNGSSILSTRNLIASGYDVEGRFINPASGDVLISRSHSDQQNGELATNGTNVLATWDEEIGGDRQIFAARFGPGGRALDGPGIQISTGAGLNLRPSAAWNGSVWLMAWTRTTKDGTVAVARRLSPAGTVIDSEDIVLGPASTTAPRVATDGASWLVAWTASRNVTACGHQSNRPLVARISSGGSVLDPGGIDIAPDLARDTVSIDVAWNGSRYVAAWSTSCWYGAHSSPSYGASGALLSADLTSIEPFAVGGVLNPPIAKIHVAGDANGALVAWDYGGVIGYELVTAESAPRSGRSRAVAAPRIAHTVLGVLVGVARSATGQFMLFTRKKIPWAAYDGVFFSILGPDGNEIGSGLGAILTNNEQFTGHVVRQGSYAWVTDSRFDAPGGAQRQWMASVDGAR